MKYYLTTPIYYVNSTPHIGHAYSTSIADAIRRFKRMQGYEAVLTTGTDEHGQNVERAARDAGRTPQEFADTVAAAWRGQWDRLGIQYDRFIRTSDPAHHEMVRWLFQRCLERGYIYPGAYTGQYCFHCELYVSDAKPGDPCPDCGRPTETVTEQNYFFRLSAFQSRLLELYEQDPKFIQPDTRRNEVTSFVKQGLHDLSITRTTIQWGIPVPVEGRHVFYVWFDALVAYMTGAKQGDLWPADLHLIGKEIVRFHAVYWPAFLMAADLPLPKRIVAHGWLLFQEDKMSKSRGNVVRADPIRRVVGIDGLRYFLLREIAFGQDGGFSYDALVGRYNSDLANGLGNLASRTLTMISKYCGGSIPEGSDPGIERLAGEVIAQTIECYETLDFARALEAIWSLQAAVDKHIVENKPWALAEAADAGSRAQLSRTLGTAAEALRVVSVLIYPAMPGSAEKIWRQLGQTEPLEAERIDRLAWGGSANSRQIGRIEAVFPRLDKAEAIQKMRELEEQEKKEQAALLGQVQPAPAAAAASAQDARITIDDFSRIDMRVGLVKSAERVKGADKLLHMMVDIGEPEPRSIVAGIALAYSPEQMVGRKVVIVANLQPRKLRGVESNGMVLAASLPDGAPVLAAFLEDVPAGARLK